MLARLPFGPDTGFRRLFRVDDVEQEPARNGVVGPLRSEPRTDGLKVRCSDAGSASAP